jgi:SRSO17 transposase
MDANQIRKLRPRLKRYLRRFDDCFARKDTREHLTKYVEGQLSDLPRKSIEPMALKMGVPVRTLQEFLSQYQWDDQRMVDRVQEIVRTGHASPQSIGILDETSFVKKGDKTPGVQRQHCGAVGKQENCIVTVHLSYAAGDFHCLLDGDLFLPESWSNDRPRCREAGIPDHIVYRPKSAIALELYDRARAHGLTFAWLTFDEWYGVKPHFLRALDQRKQPYVGEIHKHFAVWIKPPRVTRRSFRRRGRGRSRNVPRLVAGSRPALHVENVLRYHLRKQPWQQWRLKDGEKGPMVREVKHTLIYLPGEDGLPAGPYHLLVCRDVSQPDAIKYFVSNAPPETPVHVLLRVAFSRWRIERCYEDQKGEVGLDHYEGRRYLGLKRHLALTAVSYLFLAQTRQALSGKKSAVDGLPSAHGGGCVVERLVAERTLVRQAHSPGGRGNRLGTEKERTSAEKPHQDHAAKTAATGHQANGHQTRSLEHDLAL